VPSDGAVLDLRDAGRLVDGRWLWRGLTLTLHAGERVALAGPSGSGKTLLLRAMAGLDGLDEGSLTLHGTPLADWSMPAYRSHVAYVAQRPALVEGTVEDNLRVPFGLRAHAQRRWDRTWVSAALERLGRDERFLTQDAVELSGGEQQLVALVRRLQLEPSVLLLDEPSASLDDTSARALETLVDDWHASSPSRTSLWTSHHREQLTRVTNRAVRLVAPP
jgi:putative ABC transport system ATP-binding protein